MQFAPTQIASSPRVAGRSTRRRPQNTSRQLALFGDATRALPLTSSPKRLVLDTAPAATTPARVAPAVSDHAGSVAAGLVAAGSAPAPACRVAAPVLQAPLPTVRALPVVRPSAVAVLAPLPPTQPQVAPAGAHLLTAEDEVWQPMSGVQKLLEIGGASLLMVACVALAIFW